MSEPDFFRTMRVNDPNGFRSGKEQAQRDLAAGRFAPAPVGGVAIRAGYLAELSEFVAAACEKVKKDFNAETFLSYSGSAGG